MDERLTALLAVIIPLAIIQLGLMIWAIIDLVRRERVRGGSKLIWALVIVFVSTIGSILYLVWGRQE
ncbi:MAG TPA: PLD nuclease N-terminal domain-containing protein [Thermoleophilia bacterium]|nr:PLD nuclease N-terminal domain-containing protein [Thermoleophilia bacterium]